VTLGCVLALATRDRHAALSSIEDHAFHVARRLRRRNALQDADIDDLAHDALVVACSDAFAPLRRRPPETPLAAWLTVTLRNLLRRRRRDHFVSIGEPLVADHPATSADEQLVRAGDGLRARRDVGDLIEALPSEQKRVLRALLDEGTERRAAERLGVTRSHVHDVKRRAMSRLRSGELWAPRGDRRWAHSAAARASTTGDAADELILTRHSDGATYREIAAATGLTVDSVRGRISRRRRSTRVSSNVQSPPRPAIQECRPVVGRKEE
jgi:RNA polymerase sigma factor (sigma-70 family)